MARIIARMVGLLLAIGTCGGCQVISRDRPIAVSVVDAETKKPIGGAEVKISYPMSQSGVSLENAVTTAGADGIARSKVASTSDYGLILTASSNGYLPADLNVSSDSVHRIPAPGLFESSDGRPPNYQLELFASPDFAVELTVPTSFRGLIHLKTRFEQGVTFPTGQRTFKYEVPSSDPVELRGPFVLRHVLPVDYVARYPDGTPLPKTPDDLTVGFRWWKSNGDDEFFVVGTKPEIEAYMRSLGSSSGESTGRGAGSGGRGRGGAGGGGRRHGGNSGGGALQSPIP
jgi:hypothetical protein